MQTAAAFSSLTVAQPLSAHRGVSVTPKIPSSVSSTPKPIATPRPHPSSAVPRPSSVVPRPSSTVPRPSSTATSLNVQSQPPLTVSAPINANPESMRGKKREREDGTIPVNGVLPTVGSIYMNGVANGNGVQKMNAKAGLAGVRPRPIKKQRMVGHCQLLSPLSANLEY